MNGQPKKILTVLGLLVVYNMVTLGVDYSLSAQGGKNNHRCEVDDQETLTLARDGRANASIAIPKDACAVVKFAAEELRTFLNRSTKADFQIVNEMENDGPAIILGDNQWTRDLGVNAKGIPRDGFVIRTISDKIVIVGRDDQHVNPERNLGKGTWANYYQRGTLYGVYHFLEKFAGVKFYFPGEYGTIVPQNETLAIPKVDVFEAPDFVQRKVSVRNSGDWFGDVSAKETARLKQLDMLRLLCETEYIPNCHGLARLDLGKRFAKTNPDFFALLKNGKRDNDLSLPGHRGHLCFTNKKLEDEIYQDAVAFLTGKSPKERNIKRGWSPSGFQAGCFNVMPQDGHGERNYCQCAECQKYYAEGRAGELVWTFVANIANRLKRDGVPGYVTAMAYGNSKEVPKINLPDNVLVMLALQGPWADRVPEKRKANDQLIKAWNAKIAPREVWLWNYAGKVNNLDLKGVPHITPRTIGNYYHRVAPDILGAYMESESDWFIYGYLNFYVFFKIAWNNSTDVDALLKEHYATMFGSGAGPMETFFNRLETLWLDKCLGEVVDTPLGPVSHPPSENVIWEQIYSDATLADLRKLFDEAEKATKDEPECLKRIVFMRRNLLGKIIEAKNDYLRKQKKLDDLVFEVTPLKEEIVIDGEIGDEWRNASRVAMVPLKDDTALTSTEILAFWTENDLYLAIDCREPLKDKLSFTTREEDDKLIWRDASVEIFLNPSGDRMNYYQIIVNPAASHSDLKITKDGHGGKTMDWEWDCDVEVKSRISPDGWQVEMKIPIKELGVDNIALGEDFIANFCRSRNLKDVSKKENQYYSWSPFLKKSFHDVNQFGTMKFTNRRSKSISIVDNGGFEEINGDKARNWSTHKKLRNYVSVDDETFQGGGHSLRITAPPEGDIFVTQRLPTMKPNTKYLLTYFIKTKDVNPLKDGKGGACVNVYTDENIFLPMNKYQGTTPWTKQGFAIETNDKLTGKYIRLRILGASGTVWFDDVRLRETPDEEDGRP